VDVDDRVYGLRIDDDARRPLALLLDVAIHPTLRRRRHLAFSRDLAGALEDVLAERLPGAPTVLFVNAAPGDVSPMGPPAGTSPTVDEHLRGLAARFAERLAPAWEEAGGSTHRTLRLACARVARRLATPRLLAGCGDRGALVDALAGPPLRGDAAQVVADVLALPANVALWSLAQPELRVGFSFRGAAGLTANLEDHAGSFPRAFGAWVFDTGDEGGAAARFGLAWLPGEATTALARAWRARAAAAGLDDLLLAGFAGGSCAYVTSPREYRAGGYEAVGTLFGPATGADVGDALEAAWRAALEAN
jgi:hypothetical protein